MADLQGRIALVTGGAQGIGRAIAEELAAAGAVLALADVNEAKLAETVGEFKAKGVEAAAFTINVIEPGIDRSRQPRRSSKSSAKQRSS